MLTRSISRTEAAPIPMLTARWRIFTANRVRASGVSRFESSTPAIARTSGGMMTAQATTGPARGPRPTSSTPAISGPAVARRSRSIVLHRRRRRAPAIRLLPGAGAGGGHRRLDLLLANARGLAGEVAQVVELRAAHAAAADDRDVRPHRAVHREDALDADAVRDLADRERLADPAAAAGDAHPLEGLEALLVALAHAHVHAQGVARPERRDVAEPLFLGFDEGMHMT